MVNTGNHAVTMLIFSIFCFPMITDDKKPGYTVAFYICLLPVIFKLLTDGVVIFQPLIKAYPLFVNGNNFNKSGYY